MPYHDVECTKCGIIITNYYQSSWPPALFHDDGGELVILWSAPARSASVHPFDRTVIYRNPLTGDVAYPPRNDAPMPDRYRKAGYQRVEFEHARDVERFEKEKGVTCEGLWYNSGNGA